MSVARHSDDLNLKVKDGREQLDIGQVVAGHEQVVVGGDGLEQFLAVGDSDDAAGQAVGAGVLGVAVQGDVAIGRTGVDGPGVGDRLGRRPSTALTRPVAPVGPGLFPR